MTDSLHVAVIGNCQASPLARMLESVAPAVWVKRVVIVHLAKPEERTRVYSALEQSDVVLAQRVVDNYPLEFVRNANLREAFGDKVVVWPNLYYRGYSPELVYLRNAGRPLQGPLGDYHLSPIHEEWKKGRSLAESIATFRDVEYNAERFSTVPEDSLRELVQREADCDVTISDYVARERWRQRLFFTFNHPTKAALVELAKRVLDHTGWSEHGSAEAVAGLAASPAEPLGRWRVPMNPWIAQTAGSGLKDIKRFRANEVDMSSGLPTALAEPVLRLTLEEIAATYYRIYDTVFGT